MIIGYRSCHKFRLHEPIAKKRGVWLCALLSALLKMTLLAHLDKCALFSAQLKMTLLAHLD